MISYRWYRDAVVVLFILLIYPLLVGEPFAGRPPQPGQVPSLLLLIWGFLGILANFFKLRSLDADIAENNLQKLSDVVWLRFLASTVALPVFPLFGLSLYFGNLSGAWFGVTYFSLAISCALIFGNFGRGKYPQQSTRMSQILGDTFLLLFELSLYTLFLESFNLAEPNFHITIKTIFLLIIPMSLLFVLLFLPATLGFYIEELVVFRSRGMAFLSMYFRFIFFRYLPITFGLYLRFQSNPW